jgi:hypothetical protein
MAIVLDEVTRAAYLAQSLASSRASLVVSALTTPVVVEVYDGLNVLRASGTMAVPWATSSGSTITVGEVNASGITVSSGGSPDANWYCQFKGANGRFVRGTFGVSGSGRDFKWSLTSFQTGSRGTLGTVTVTAAGTSPRIYSSDLTYVGSFRLPNPSGGSFNLAGFGGTRTGMAFNPAGNGGAGSLYVVGEFGQVCAEVSIPTLNDSGVLGNLSTAATLQNFADPTEGQYSEIDPSPQGTFMRGLYVHNGRLIVGAYDFYDANGSQVASHFSRPLNLSTTGDVKGAVPLVANLADVRYPVGGMCAVPAAVQSAYGIKPVLTGGGGGSILSGLSAGPSAFAFDPDDIGVSTINAQPLMYYPWDTSGGVARHLPALFGYMTGMNMPSGANAVANEWWVPTSFASAVAWLETRPVVLFCGTHASGNPWYGSTDGAGNFVSGSGAGAPPGGTGYDPARPGGGEHAYPYNMQFWAYDQSELISVLQGSKQPWQATPYARWSFSSPFTQASTTGFLTGCTHDPATRRIFVAEYAADGGKPLVHVYTYPAS